MKNTSQKKKKLIPKEIYDFNFGALLLNYFWLIGNGCLLQFILLGGIQLFLVIAVPEIPYTVECVMCKAKFHGIQYFPYISNIPLYFFFFSALLIGWRGNRWAWKKLERKEIFSYIKKQGVWFKYGLTIWVVLFLLYYILGYVLFHNFYFD